MIGSLLWICLMPPTVEDLSAVERSRPDFYQALATKTKLTTRWELETARVPLDRDTALTLIIEGVANPAEVLPPDLGQAAPSFAQRFKLIGPVDRQIAGTSVRFLYRLRPLPPPGEVRLPPIKFVYYRTDFPNEIRFQTAYTPAVSAEILPSAQASATPSTPLAGPTRFFSLRTTEPWLTSAAWPWVGLPVWTVLLAVPLILALLKRLFPDAAQRLALSRRRAARVALNRLRRADTPEAIRHALRDYLQLSVGMPEIVTQIGGADLLQEVDAVLAECDAAQFGHLSVNLVSLRQRAEAIVRQCEAARSPPRRAWWLCLVILPVLLGMDPTRRDAPEELFHRALARRDQPDHARELFREAARLWSAQPRSPRQASNQARALFWAGDLPGALAAVHQALALTPWDRELQSDLQTLRDQVAYPTTEPSLKPRATRSWRSWLGPGEALVIFLLLAGLLAFSLTGWLVHGASVGRWMSGFVVLISLAFQVSLLSSSSSSDLCIIREPVRVYAGNSPLYDLRRVEPLPIGAEVRVRHERGGWLQVELPNGLVGWIPASTGLAVAKLQT